MILSEIALPAGSEAMNQFSSTLLASYRRLAAEHGLTIDGGWRPGMHSSLPIVRRNFILMGGALRPAGGVKGEEKRQGQHQPIFKYRVHDFLKKLLSDLGRLQVHALGDDLSANFHVYVGTALAPLKLHSHRADETSVDDWFGLLEFGVDERKLPQVQATWLIAK